MVRACRINGTVVDEDEVRMLFRTVSDIDRLAATGGFLYKARFDEDVAHIGVLPVIEGAARNYHYEITLDNDEWPSLSGAFFPDRTVQALCLPRRGQTPTSADTYVMREQIERFSLFVVEYGFPIERGFDWITVQWLTETDIFENVPKSIGEVATDHLLRPADGN